MKFEIYKYSLILFKLSSLSLFFISSSNWLRFYLFYTPVVVVVVLFILYTLASITVSFALIRMRDKQLSSLRKPKWYHLGKTSLRRKVLFVGKMNKRQKFTTRKHKQLKELNWISIKNVCILLLQLVKYKFQEILIVSHSGREELSISSQATIYIYIYNYLYILSKT